MGARHYVEGNRLGVGLCQKKIEGTPPSLRFPYFDTPYHCFGTVDALPYCKQGKREAESPISRDVPWWFGLSMAHEPWGRTKNLQVRQVFCFLERANDKKGNYVEMVMRVFP